MLHYSIDYHQRFNKHLKRCYCETRLCLSNSLCVILPVNLAHCVVSVVSVRLFVCLLVKQQSRFVAWLPLLVCWSESYSRRIPSSFQHYSTFRLTHWLSNQHKNDEWSRLINFQNVELNCHIFRCNYYWFCFVCWFNHRLVVRLTVWIWWRVGQRRLATPGGVGLRDGGPIVAVEPSEDRHQSTAV